MSTEHPAYRWTMGNALIPLQNERILTATTLSIEVIRAGPYIKKKRKHYKSKFFLIPFGISIIKIPLIESIRGIKFILI